MSKTIKFDPRLFISPPYIKCPDCGADKFGVLSIGPHSVSRRCAECLRPGGRNSVPLPKLKKRIVYLDQNILSEMMKAINPGTKANQRGSVDPQWLVAFQKLDRLCKLQLLVCPDSGFHDDESLLSPFYGPLKRMYELLSNGITFDYRTEIESRQLFEHARQWAKGAREYSFAFDSQEIVSGELHGWQDRLIISANLNYGEEWIEQLRQAREDEGTEFKQIFDQWQQQPNTFDHWLETEYRGYGRAVVGSFREAIIDYARMESGQVQFSMSIIDRALNAFGVVDTIEAALKREGVPEGALREKAFEYLLADDIRHIPYLRISAMLYAAIARKAGADSAMKCPSRGTFNDVSAIALFLPYCDAIFVDNACRALLSENPVRDRLGFGTRVFSKSNIEDFFEWLDSIEREAPQKHIELVNYLYGKDWATPFTSMYIADEQMNKNG